jgi:hypothetical protein
VSSSSCTWEYKAKHRQEFPSARCFGSRVWVWEQHNKAHPLAAAEILSKDSRIRIIICHSLNSHEADAEYEKLWT